MQKSLAFLLIFFSSVVLAQKTKTDVTPPTVKSIYRQAPTAAVTNATSVTFRVTFSEKVSGVDAPDFIPVFSGVTGSIVGVTKVGTSGTTYDVKMGSLTGNGTVKVTLRAANSNIKDAAGNMLSTDFTDGDSYTIDQVRPAVVSINRYTPLEESTTATSLVFRVTFSEGVSGVDAADFSLYKTSTATGTIGTVSGSGAVYDVAVGSISGSGTLRLDLKATGTAITDAAGNALSGGFSTGQSYTLGQKDVSAPSVMSINRQVPTTATTNATSVVYRVAFSEPASGVDPGDFTPTVVSGSVTAIVASLAPVSNSSAYDVTLNSISGNGTLRLDLNANAGIKDSAGNILTTAYTTGQTYTIDQEAPEVKSITRQSPTTANTNATSVTYRVIFSEAVGGVDKSDFTVQVLTGSIAAAISSSTPFGSNGTTYDVTVGSIAGNGTLRLDLNAGSTGIKDTVGNSIADGDYTAGQAYSIDQTAPTVAITRGVPATQVVSVASVTYQVVFSEAVVGVDIGDFSLTALSGTVIGTLGTVSGSGAAYEVSVNAIAGSGDLRLDLKSTGTAIADAAGNAPSGGYTGETYTVVELDITAPAVVGINRQSPTTAGTASTSLVYRVTFSEPVSGADANDFTATIVSGALSAVVSSLTPTGTAGSSFDITISPVEGNGTLRLDLNANAGIKDSAGNILTTAYTTGQTYTIDQAAPTISSINRQSPSTATTTATSVTYRVTFSEAVSGVDKSDFSLTAVNGDINGTIDTVTGTATTYDVNVGSVTGFGALRLDLNAGSTGIKDTVGNSIAEGGYTAGQSYTWEPDITPPTVVGVLRQSPTTQSTSATSVTFRVTFSEKVNGVDGSDFSATAVSGSPGAIIGTVAAVGTGGTTYDVAVGSITGLGELRLDLNPSGTGITDAAGNVILDGGYTEGQSYIIVLPADVTPPAVVSINRYTPLEESTTATSLVFRVTFSEGVSGVDAADFSLYKTSTATGTIGTVSGSGAVYDVAVGSISGSGTLRLDLKATGTAITDAAGNALSGGFSTGQSYTVAPATTNPMVVPFGATWKYLDIGVNQGNAWRYPSFDDAGWKSGPAQLGYGDGDEATVVSYGPDPNYKYPTTYFRKTISIADITAYSSFAAKIKRDDGVVVYVNGVEVYRNNMPSGTIYYSTYASSSASDNGNTAQAFAIALSSFVTGTNTLAVEIHQASRSSSDISFDLEITGTVSNPGGTPPSVVSINRQSPLTDTTSASEVTFRATFSEAVSGVDTSDFVVTAVSGRVTGTVSSISTPVTSGKVYDITVSSLKDTGVVRLDLKNSNTGIKDGDGNAINGGYTNGQTYAVNTGIINPGTQPNILYYENFESGTGFAGMHMQTSTTYGFTVVDKPTYRDVKVGRWELRAGDPPAATGTRAEVLFSESLALQETWHSFAGYFPSDGNVTDTAKEIFNQWHQGEEFGTPMLTFMIKNDRFMFRKRLDAVSHITYDLGPLIKDQWVGIVIRIKQHLKQGIVQVWINGYLKLDLQNTTTMFDGPYGKYKMGIYKSAWNDNNPTLSDKRIWYVDEVKIGNATSTYESMKPTGNNITVLPPPATSTTTFKQEHLQENDREPSLFEVYPTVIKRGTALHINAVHNEAGRGFVSDMTGRLLFTFKANGSTSIRTDHLPNGHYFLTITGKKQLIKRRFIVTN